MEYLTKIIGIGNLEQFNKEFSNYKGRILSLISAISKFKENLLNDIENHPDYIDYNLLKNSSSQTTSKKKK